MFYVYNAKSKEIFAECENIEEVHDVINEIRHQYIEMYGWDYWAAYYSQLVTWSPRWRYDLRMLWPAYVLAAVLGALMAVL